MLRSLPHPILAPLGRTTRVGCARLPPCHYVRQNELFAWFLTANEDYGSPRSDMAGFSHAVTSMPWDHSNDGSQHEDAQRIRDGYSIPPSSPCSAHGANVTCVGRCSILRHSREIGRASCRERGKIWVGAGAF